jgi:hypothetical protein
MTRARLVAVTVHLTAVADDGETLHPLQLEPLVVPAAAWPPDLDAVLAGVQRQLDAVEGPVPPVDEPAGPTSSAFAQ